MSIPSPARIYDYLLGGKDNFEVDRAAAKRVLAVAPDTRDLALANRGFLARAVRLLTASGVRQFVDLGTGIPTSPSVHEVAREAVPRARVAYVDRDPIVFAHDRALLETDAGLLALQEDIRNPEAIVEGVAPLIDFAEPVGLLAVAVLHFVSDDEDPAGILAAFRERMAPGGHLVLSHMTTDGDAEAMAILRRAVSGTETEAAFRPHDEVLRLFDGFELLDPGLVPVTRWRADEPATRLTVEGAVARLP